MKRIKGLEQTLLCAAALLAGIAAVFPLVWMLTGSLKTKDEVMGLSGLWPQVVQWGNYGTLLAETKILRYVANSLFVGAATAGLQVCSGVLFAYALVFIPFKGKKLLFAAVMATHMLPSAATYIPSYLILAKFHLLDTYQGLVLSNTVSMAGIFLMRQAFSQLPSGVVEAARIDGASNLRILWEIALPLIRPVLVTFLLTAFIGGYNNYMWPSLITESPQYSLVSQGLRRILMESGAYGTQWQIVMAAGSAAVAPLLLLFAAAQKPIMSGITDSGMKG